MMRSLPSRDGPSKAPCSAIRLGNRSTCEKLSELPQRGRRSVVAPKIPALPPHAGVFGATTRWGSGRARAALGGVPAAPVGGISGGVRDERRDRTTRFGAG